MPLNDYNQIVGVEVFLEGKRRRRFVGTLTRKNDLFHFEYNMRYLRTKNVISLGPEMPLTRKTFESKTLFIPFSDRIPSRENPAYEEYCQATGISPNETDPFVLLITIAHRGPSSFIFCPLYENTFSAEQLLAFRQSLGFSVKEFAAAFDFSPAAITRIEKKQSSGRDILKRLEIYVAYPEVALDQLKLRSGHIHPNKYKTAAAYLRNHLK
jgi:HipA-like protein